MFCGNCGKEIPNEARFCTECGAAVIPPESPSNETSGGQEASPSKSPQAHNGAEKTPSEESGSAPTNAAVSDTESDAVNAPNAEEPPVIEAQAAGEAQAAPVPQFAIPAQPEANTMDAAANPEAASLKAAVAQNKKRSRRHLPMIVLVALALALATSVAFAAHYVYTNVWLPAHQEQTQQTPAAESPQEPTAEEETQEQPAETITYSSNKTYEYVNVPSDPYRSPGQKTSQKWTYDQLTSEKLSAGAQAINGRIKTAFDATESKSSSYPSTIADLDRFLETADNDDFSCTLGRDISISYFKNDIVGVYDSRYATNFGASGGWPVLQGAAYNVNTGESVTPQSAFGLSTEEAIAAAQTAVRTYLESNPSSLSTSEACKSIATRIKSTEASGLGEDLEGSSCLALTEKGLAYLSAYGELGSYAYGAHAIIIASDDSSLVGTEITSKEIHGIE